MTIRGNEYVDIYGIVRKKPKCLCARCEKGRQIRRERAAKQEAAFQAWRIVSQLEDMDYVELRMEREKCGTDIDRWSRAREEKIANGWVEVSPELWAMRSELVEEIEDFV